MNELILVAAMAGLFDYTPAQWDGVKRVRRSTKTLGRKDSPEYRKSRRDQQKQSRKRNRG
jgi:hypothetical protein